MIKKEKRIPLRKCTICGEHKDKFNLIRVVKNKDEGISVDLTYKKNGRGAYICKSMECYEKAKKSSRLKNALQSNIDEKIYEKIKEIIMNS
ncbi:hypothetical protein HMPREF1987_00640 [Peptostreptococcaceae bacterium oral taxon 113 str. W5053]|nr:hypothetical protein HMPREF1987_00640 [Peptostreptococcaceae bacterium oral taxon 113 str. W5053]